MKPTASRHAALFVFAAASILLITASCGDQTAAPPSSSDPGFAQIPGIAPAEQSLPSRDGSLEATDGPTNTFEQISVPLLPGVGGLVMIGRYSVLVPADALTRPTVITIIVREETGLVSCELLPHGLSFSNTKPVLLRMNVGGTELAARTSMTIYWFDDQTATWVDVGGLPDPTGSTVSANLTHFSRYAVGESGM